MSGSDEKKYLRISAINPPRKKYRYLVSNESNATPKEAHKLQT